MSSGDEKRRGDDSGDQTVVRGRPGRRTAKEKSRAVLEVLSGRRSVDQVAREFGVLPETVEGWREKALEGIEATLASGDGKSERERELEAKLRAAEEALKLAMIERALAIKAVDEWKEQTRPSRPTRSRR